MRAQAIRLFTETFGVAPQSIASAPGYVPLLGDAYGENGGPVLAIASGGRVVVAVAAGDDGIIEAIRTPERRRERFDMAEARGPEWCALLAGVLRTLESQGAAPRGARVAVANDMLLASVAVAAARAFAALGRVRLSNRQLAGVAFRAEPNANGAGGVAAHTAAALARHGHAMLIEATSADLHQIPFNGSVLLVDSGVAKAGDAATRGAQRRAECAAALARLKLELPELVWLASWPTAWLPRLKKSLAEPIRSRALYVVGEAARARFGAQLLAGGRRKRFGALLSESHEAWRRLHDSSSAEQDRVVRAALRAGALGARATGRGGEVLVLPARGGREQLAGAIRRTRDCDPAFIELSPDSGVRLERA